MERDPRHSPRAACSGDRLSEAFDELWDSFVDRDDDFYDADGTRWLASTATSAPSRNAGVIFDQTQLAEIRCQCRALAAGNAFAINGHENRISYIVGSGHAYRVLAKPAPPRRRRACGRSAGRAGRIRPREQVAQAAAGDRPPQGPRRRVLSAALSRPRRHDAACGSSSRARWPRPRNAAAIRRRPWACRPIRTTWRRSAATGSTANWSPPTRSSIARRNVDANVRRGLPLFFPVRKNLRRADKLLRNMSAVAEIQSAIALIRKHQRHQRRGLGPIRRRARPTARRSIRPRAGARNFRRYAPGTILDAMAGTEYEFPAAALDAGRYVAVLQAELRAIAARLVMPEFMFTSDASNANYTSTMVAEGPAVKMFDRLQHDMIEDDLELLFRVVGHAVEAGRLPVGADAAVDIRAIAPTLAVRDRLRDAQADQILVRYGAMSPATMAMRHGLDPSDVERASGTEEA